MIGSLSGWGPAGPYAARAGHDLTYQAVAGAAEEALQRPGIGEILVVPRAVEDQGAPERQRPGERLVRGFREEEVAVDLAQRLGLAGRGSDLDQGAGALAQVVAGMEEVTPIDHGAAGERLIEVAAQRAVLERQLLPPFQPFPPGAGDVGVPLRRRIEPREAELGGKTVPQEEGVEGEIDARHSRVGPGGAGADCGDDHPFSSGSRSSARCARPSPKGSRRPRG
ncbi:MAG TPA: hypothetical protein VGM86_05830 [Thermoanaerobaculia bacterium]